MYGIKDQLARAASFEEARSQHVWKVSERYNIEEDCVERWVRNQATADRTALTWVRDGAPDRNWTWRDLSHDIRRFANALGERLAVGRGDVVAVILPQRPETAIAHMATLRLGAVGLPVSKLFGSDGVAARIAEASPKVVIVDDESRATLEAALAQLPLRPAVVNVDGSQLAADLSFWDLLEQGSTGGMAASTRPADPALLIYTSGTTSNPKGVLHGHRVGLAHANIGYLLDYLGPHDIYHAHADWAWVAGLLNGLIGIWGFGAQIVCYAGRFDPERTRDIMLRNGVTVGFLAPTALRLMKDTPLPREQRLRSVFTGGEAITAELNEWAVANVSGAVNVSFGQTEANDLVGQVSVWDQAPFGSIGRPLPGHDVQLVDDAGEPVPSGEVGQLAVRADGIDPVIMLGYYDKPDETAKKYLGDWFLTGDYGVADERGYIHFTGRDDDIIKVSGYRVGAIEVENCLLKNEAVATCAVYSAPDPVRGHQIQAIVVLRPDTAGTDELRAQLRDDVRARLGRHAYPRQIDFVGEIPRTVTGKIDRGAVKRLLVRSADPAGREGA